MQPRCFGSEGEASSLQDVNALETLSKLLPRAPAEMPEASVPAEAAPSPRPQIEAPGLLHLLQQHQGGLPLPALLAGAQSRIEGDDLVGTLLKSQNLWTAFDLGNIQIGLVGSGSVLLFLEPPAI